MALPHDIVLPRRIGRVAELANNLWWSWHEDGWQVFRSLDYAQWRATDHNPVKQLCQISPAKIKSTAKAPGLFGALRLCDAAI